MSDKQQHPLQNDTEAHKQGDVILAQVGEGASRTTVGKWIVVVESLGIPLWLAIAILAVLGIAAVAAWLRFTSIEASIGALSPGIATANAPTPIPPPTPMTGDVNVLIARPSPVGTTELAQVKQFQAWNIEEMKELVAQGFQDHRLEESGFRAEVAIVPDHLQSVDEFIAYAQDVGAHILLYGTLDLESTPVKYLPRFYIHPRFEVAGVESSGEDAFGAPIAVPMSAQGADEIAWREKLRGPLTDLARFITGLGFFDAGSYDKAQEQFESVTDSLRGTAGKGESIVYLWLGTTHFAQAVEEQSRGLAPTPVYCQASGLEEDSHATCALRSYAAARDLDANYPRAYMGIGNYWLEFEQGLGCMRFARAIEQYQLALKTAAAAQGTAAEYVALVHAPLRINYQIGQANVRALISACADPLAYDAAAVAALNAASDEYAKIVQANPEPDSLSRDLAARTYFQLGIAHAVQQRFDAAIGAFQQVMHIAEPDGPLVDPWQSIYWIALNQIGAIRVAQVESGDMDHLQTAEATLLEVTQAYDDHRFGSNYATEPFTASAAWFYLGRLYGLTAQNKDGSLNVVQLRKAENAYASSIATLRETEETDPQLISYRSDGLPWISHFELAETYRRWFDARPGDQGKADAARNAYHVVIDAAAGGRVAANNELAAGLYARAALGLGLLDVAAGEFETATKWLNVALAAANGNPEIVDRAESALAQIRSGQGG